MIKIEEESFTDGLPNLKVLLYPHHDEVEDGTWKFNPDYEMYQKYDEMGLLHYITIRDGGKLVGYSLDIITPSMHYKGKVAAMNDGVYLLPEYRHLGLMKKILKKVTDDMKKLNIVSHTVLLKVKNPCRSMMQELGYHNQELVWMRRL